MTVQTAPAGESLRSSRPRAADFRSRMRGGGLLTVAMSQRLGSYLCVPAHRMGLPPAVLTLGGLACGVAGATLVLVGGSRPHTVVVAMLLWQLAYCFDCADGQLARYTGRTSEAGARLDVMCDLLVHAAVVVAIVVSAARYDPAVPRWLTSAFACAVMINLSALVRVPSGSAAGSLSRNRSTWILHTGALLFDYPVFLAAYAGVVVLLPGYLDLFLIAVLTTSVLLQAVRIVKAADVSIRGPRP
jgi:phosphatidylglycerophosphate synthase